MACKSEQACLKHLIVPYLFMYVTHATRIDSLSFQSQGDFFFFFFFAPALETHHSSPGPGGGGVLDTMVTARMLPTQNAMPWGENDQELAASKI